MTAILSMLNPAQHGRQGKTAMPQPLTDEPFGETLDRLDTEPRPDRAAAWPAKTKSDPEPVLNLREAGENGQDADSETPEPDQDSAEAPMVVAAVERQIPVPIGSKDVAGEAAPLQAGEPHDADAVPAADHGGRQETIQPVPGSVDAATVDPVRPDIATAGPVRPFEVAAASPVHPPAIPQDSRPDQPTAAADSPPAQARIVRTTAASEVLVALATPAPKAVASGQGETRRSEDGRVARAAPPDPARGLAVDIPVERPQPAERPEARIRRALSELALNANPGSREQVSPVGERPAGQGNVPSAPSPATPAAIAVPTQTTGENLAIDLSRTVSARAAVVDAQAAREARGTGPVGIQTLRLQLQPLHLGSVTVELNRSDDRLQVDIQAETEEAYKKLTVDSDDIVRTLRGLGFEVDRVHVSLNAQAAAQSAPSGARQEGQQQFSADRGAGEGNQEARQQGRGASSRGEGDAKDLRPGDSGVYI